MRSSITIIFLVLYDIPSGEGALVGEATIDWFDGGVGGILEGGTSEGTAVGEGA